MSHGCQMDVRWVSDASIVLRDGGQCVYEVDGEHAGGSDNWGRESLKKTHTHTHEAEHPKGQCRRHWQ